MINKKHNLKNFLNLIIKAICFGIISGLIVCIIEYNFSKRVFKSKEEIRIEKVVSSEGHQYNLFLNGNHPFSMEHRMDCKKCFEDFE